MFGKNVKLVRFDSDQPRSKRFYLEGDEKSNKNADERGLKKGASPLRDIFGGKTSKKEKKLEGSNVFEKKALDEPEDDLLWVGPDKPVAPKIRKKPMLTDEELLDYAVKQKIQEIFMFLFFLIVTSMIVLMSQTASSAYLSRAMHAMFVDTPFLELADEMAIPSETNTSVTRPGTETEVRKNKFLTPTAPTIPETLPPDSVKLESWPPDPFETPLELERKWTERPFGSIDLNKDISKPVLSSSEILPESGPAGMFYPQVNITSVPPAPLASASSSDSEPLVMEESAPQIRMDTPVVESPDILYKGYDWRGVLATAKKVLAERNLKRSSTIQDFWDFLDTTFINMIYWRYWYSNEDPIAHTEVEDMQLLFSSKLIGVPRMRQVRVRPDSCTIHPSVNHYFNSCITYYSSSVEDTSAIHPVSTLVETQPAWKYSLPVETDAVHSHGKISTYGPGGYYLDLEYTKPLTQKIFLELKQNKWVTRQTRAVIIDFTVYNANTNLFVVSKLIFEMPPTGGMTYNARFEPLKFFRYVETEDYVVLGGEIVFIMFMFYFTAFLIHGSVQGGFRYLKHFGVQLTIVVNVMGWACVALGGYRFFMVESEAAELVSTHNDTYPNFESVRNVQADFNKLSSFMLFFAWVRAVLYLKYCQWIQPLFRTIGERENRKALMGLMVLFFAVIFSLAQLGYLIFGDQAYQFRSLADATVTQFAAIIGNFNYEELHHHDPLMATIYLIVYVFFIFFILLMLFAAVISHSYSISRATVAPVKDRLVSAYLCSFVLRFFTCGRKRRTEEQNVLANIRHLLKRAGYTELEIDMFFCKFGVDASTNLSEEQKKKVIDKLELRQFEFDSIAVSPQAVAEMQDEVNRLQKTVDDLTKELEVNNQLMGNLGDNVSKMKKTMKTQKMELDKARKEAVVVKPEVTKPETSRPAKPIRNPDDDKSNAVHDLL